MSAYSDLLATLSPSLYWPLDATNGVTDQSGNGRNGTASGPSIGAHSATFPPILGEDGTCTDFDGLDDMVTSSYSPWTNGTVRTHLGWAWRDDTAAYHALIGGSGGHPVTAIVQLKTGTQDVEFYTLTAATTWTAGWPGNAQWVFWGVVFDETANNVTLYIDGAAVSTLTHADAYNASAGTFQVANWQTSASSWDGKQGHVAMFEAGLTAQNFADLYAAATASLEAPAGTFDPQLEEMAWW